MTRLCFVCKKIVSHYSKFCPRCRPHISNRHEAPARARALIAAFDKARNCFICYYTGVPLEETDRSSPWYISFDHRIPGKKGDLVVCARWVNSIKNQFSEEEFRAIIIELVRCRKTGDVFNMAVAEFKYWKSPGDHGPPTLPIFKDRRLPKISDCIVCSASALQYSRYCRTCWRIFRRQHNVKGRVAAGQAAWDPIKKGFICYLTRLKLEVEDRKSPIYVTIDHQIPRDDRTLKVAAAFVNLMKTDLSEEEIWLAVPELANHFLTGKPFNRNIIKFAYWKRPAKARKGRK